MGDAPIYDKFSDILVDLNGKIWQKNSKPLEFAGPYLLSNPDMT